jgi:hypothetical protein
MESRSFAVTAIEAAISALCRAEKSSAIPNEVGPVQQDMGLGFAQFRGDCEYRIGDSSSWNWCCCTRYRSISRSGAVGSGYRVGNATLLQAGLKWQNDTFFVGQFIARVDSAANITGWTIGFVCIMSLRRSSPKLRTQIRKR